MESALTGAVETGDVSAVLQLLRAGTDVNSAGLGGETALLVAADTGNTEILTLLLSCPALRVNQQAEHQLIRLLPNY